MTNKVGSVVWMIWRNDEGQQFKVGELSKEAKKYYFEYDMDGTKMAQEYGFSPLPYFPRLDAKYFKEELFYSFSNNLPGYGKKDITSILKKYDIQEYDDFEILKKCGSQSSTVSFEFISPYKEGEEVEINFKKEVKEKEIDVEQIEKEENDLEEK
ncbi:MAG: HipA N-terminal domain-containing protein [Clostridium sp.]|uniref:HipA N-terminal domain-containing protein n=1 Tax=Clostridium sp. TaxID=1506 RepID=UPI003D6CBBB7